MIDTLKDVTGDRKCFRLVGGVLVERTVSDVLPALVHNKEQVSLQRLKGNSSSSIWLKTFQPELFLWTWYKILTIKFFLIVLLKKPKHIDASLKFSLFMTSCNIQWNLVIKRSDITKPSYNKVILLVPALYISLFFYPEVPDITRNLIYNKVIFMIPRTSL